MRRRLSHRALVTGSLSVTLAVGAAYLVTGAGAVSLLPFPLPVTAIVVILGMAFFLAERFQLNVEFRRQAHTITPAGVVLAAGLLVLPPATLVLTRVAAATLSFAWERVSVDKTVYNGAAYAFEAAADVYLVHRLLDPGHALDLRSALVLVLVMAVVDQLMAALVLLMIRLHNGAVSRRDVLGVLQPAVALSVFSTFFALGATMLLRQGPLGALVVALMLTVSAVGYRAYAVARRQHQSLTLVHEFVTESVGAESVHSVALELLTRIRRLLRAGMVQLSIHEGDTGAPMFADSASVLTLTVDEHDRLEVTHEQFDYQDWVLLRARTEHEAFLATRHVKAAAEQRWLQRHGHRDAMVIALPEAGGLSGTLCVTDRLGETATFTQEDLALLQTLTGHLSVALRSARLVQNLGHEATHDALTDLANRRGLATAGQTRLDADPCRPRALLLLDLDKFKEVNDSLGHQAGDQLLVEIATRLRSELRETDLLARLGGDEFAILLEDAGAEEAAAMAAQLSRRLAQPFSPVADPTPLSRLTLHTTTSIGIARAPQDSRDLAGLLRKADIAMYKAKASGSGHHVYDEVDDQDGAARLLTTDQLQTAIARGEFVLHFQPKVDLATGEVTAVEALTRWEHPTRGLLFPDAFIDLVESASLMRAMTRIVLTLALEQAARWHRNGYTFSVAVNLSASSLIDEGLPDELFRMLAERAVPPSVLQLEITESFFMLDRNRARKILSRLRAQGVRISIDDYGTGYSSLSYLRDLPVDELKLDKSFVMSMTDDEQAAALVASTIGLAHSLGLRMVAEGVETQDTYAELARLGCDEAQGFYISKPLPAAGLERWLHERPTLGLALTPSLLRVPLASA